MAPRSLGAFPTRLKAAARRDLRKYVQSHSAPGERIYVGNFNHSSVMVNEVDLYFVLDRPSATRYLQFDPGMVTRAKVQSEMIDSLEKLRTHLVVLARIPWAAEPQNDSGKPRAKLLDTYLDARYNAVARFGPFEVRFRQGG